MITTAVCPFPGIKIDPSLDPDDAAFTITDQQQLECTQGKRLTLIPTIDVRRYLCSAWKTSG